MSHRHWHGKYRSFYFYFSVDAIKVTIYNIVVINILWIFESFFGGMVDKYKTLTVLVLVQIVSILLQRVWHLDPQ